MGARLGLKPYLYVELNNKDISAYITPYLISFRYLDNDGLEKDETDDVEITVADPTFFFRDNPPSRGSSLLVKFGYEEQNRFAGTFYIDSYTYSYSREGSTMTIRALAKDAKLSFRTKITTAFENTTLRSIAYEIAKRHGYNLHFVGADITFKRVTQYKERDLQFLKRLCHRYGYTLKINNKTIVIQELDTLLQNYNNLAYKITPDITMSFEVDVSSLYAGEVQVVYLDPDGKEITYTDSYTHVKNSGTTQKETVRVENHLQARKIAQAQKIRNEMKEITGRITTVGLPMLYASCFFAIEGFGKFDGVYYAASVEHIIDRSGYTTTVEFRKNPGVKK